MKFSDFDKSTWEANGKYFDTCLIPFTGLMGTESPPEAAETLERLRDLLDCIEQPFQGRIVTYPAIQYSSGDNIQYLNELCRKVKSSHFQYVIMASSGLEPLSNEIIESDLVLSLTGFDTSRIISCKSQIGREIEQMWQGDK
jgi:23S rRNA (pseudouridine1915-N3)-methyltransferase